MMERIKLLSDYHKDYESINETIPPKSFNKPSTKSNFIISKFKGLEKIKPYKCSTKMSNNGIFMIFNVKSCLDISKFNNDNNKSLLCRYFVEKDNIGYIRLKEHNVADNIEYQLTISMIDGESIKGLFKAKEAVEIYKFLRRCLKNWNIETKVNIKFNNESINSIYQSN
jgi:hypothetical protein